MGFGFGCSFAELDEEMLVDVPFGKVLLEVLFDEALFVDAPYDGSDVSSLLVDTLSETEETAPASELSIGTSDFSVHPVKHKAHIAALNKIDESLLAFIKTVLSQNNINLYNADRTQRMLIVRCCF